MAEISNNLIAGLLIVAILISAFGVITISNLIPVMGPIEVTGRALEYGTANVTITGEVAIEMIRNVTDFDSSSLGGANREITTTQVNYGTFDAGSEGNGTDQTGCSDTEATCAYPFVLENIGNTNVSINLSASQNASDWIGGNPSYANISFKGKENQSNTAAAGAACGASFTTNNDAGNFGELPYWLGLSTTETTLCSDMEYNDTHDEVRIHFNLTIPSDAIAATGTGTIVTIGAIAS